jgi:2-aminoethylphosphonate-pyruvate transaminase
MSEYYENLSNSFIKCFYNEKFESTGSFYSLLTVSKYLSGDIILLESDLLYESDALPDLFKLSEENIILASDLSFSGDEVYIDYNRKKYLVNLSKNSESIKKKSAELVGINKVSYDTINILKYWAERNNDYAKKCHYEEAFVKIINKKSFYVNKKQKLIWTEIDTEEHYRRAINYVYPKILSKENG